jgi:hypothetical protein
MIISAAFTDDAFRSVLLIDLSMEDENMKTYYRIAWMLALIAFACQGRMLCAIEYEDVTIGAQPVSQSETAVAPRGCCGEGCGACGDCCPTLGCEPGCKRYALVGFAGFDSFKGVSDGPYESNFGAVAGVNGSLKIPAWEDYGFGWQTGLSYGVYDFDGRGSTLVDQARSQQQIFLTTGFFHKAQCDRRLSYGLVHDWMFNDQWGGLGSTPTLGQWRGQFEYALSGSNAVGVWGCVRDLSAAHEFIENRPIEQINFFWHHKFCGGADSNLWIGFPERTRVTGDGSLLDWSFGASVSVPLSERLALSANAAYFHPSGAAGGESAMESGYNIGMGVIWYFGGKARTHAINGECITPYMPMGNNSNFLVDQSHNPI